MFSNFEARQEGNHGGDSHPAIKCHPEKASFHLGNLKFCDVLINILYSKMIKILFVHSRFKNQIVISEFISLNEKKKNSNIFSFVEVRISL